MAIGIGLSEEASAARRKVIIDQDAFGPGGSNMASILVLTQSPEVEVLGIMVESGDGWLKENVAHTLRLLEIVGHPEIPVLEGVTLPLVNSQQSTLAWENRYGKLHYKGAWNDTPSSPFHPSDVVPPMREGEPKLKASSESAVNFLLRQLHAYPGQITVVALGPFTNLAVAIKLDEKAATLAEGLVMMGGSLNPVSHFKDSFDQEFKHTPRLEFNFRWDPEATKATLHAPWPQITLLPVDATTMNRSSAELLAAMKKKDTPAGNYLIQYQERPMPMWDEITAAICVRPSLSKESEKLAIDVDTDAGAGYGNTLSWDADKKPGQGEPVVTVIRTIDVPAFEAYFVETIGRK
jgi:inosine-uridine nucleoside N-ribohydrolase